ncbi:transcription initiation factor TFIID subunit 8 [Humulus lupulus]|uniref:transcription initiation factor TFIID subunit 8 n=1 Tax=Humulus lupulus TaxID=3486 RepID=UPI002B40A7D9|nr:transcription initiation factor TFIID subunit 8 [Humulus lupulus]
MKPKPKPKSKPSKESQTPAIESESTPPDFSFAIAKIAVAQICNAAGFKSTRLSALDTLTHVATKYIEAIAKSSASFAAASNRSQSNIFDITNALHDLESLRGFSGASNVYRTDCCLLISALLAELSHFVDSNVETPFAKPIPRLRFFDTNRKENPNTNPNQSPNPLRAPHVPNWLPQLPDLAKCDAVSSSHQRNGEELWENCTDGSGMDGVLIENGDLGVTKSELKLGMKRERVRFKIEDNRKKHEVLKGGKRVCWDTNTNTSSFNKDYTSIVGNQLNDDDIR